MYTPNVVYKTIDITFLNEIAAANQGIGISIDYVARPFLGSNTVLRYFEDEDCTWDSMMITKKISQLESLSKYSSTMLWNMLKA